MASNPRLKITFTKRQLDFLVVTAEWLGTSTSEVVRQIVDKHRLESVPLREVHKRVMQIQGGGAGVRYIVDPQLVKREKSK